MSRCLTQHLIYAIKAHLTLIPSFCLLGTCVLSFLGAASNIPYLFRWKFLTTASNSLKNHPRIPFLMKKILESMESNCAKFFSPFQVVDSVSHRKGKQTFVFSTALIITTGMLDNLHKLYPSSLAKLFLTSLNTLVKQHGGLIAAIGNESIPKILLFCW